jgi:hypothetical protein
MNKEQEILKYSNPKTVFNKYQNLYGGEIRLSTRKDKKYMIWHNGKWIHFGQMSYQDYTKHQDMKRRDLFLKRNKRWAQMGKYTPAYLSYHLLW